MENYHLIEKSMGTLQGMAVGNALGAPANGLSKKEIQERFGKLESYQDSFDLEEFTEVAKEMDARDVTFKISRWIPKGVYTDDTQQALVLTECLIEERAFDIERFADLLCKYSQPRGRNFRFGIYRGSGRSFRESIRALEDGEDTRLAGQPSSSNGAAMRVAPLGVFYREDLDALKQHVIDQSVVTHREAMAIAAAQAVAHMVALVLPRRTAPDARELLSQVLEHVRAAEDLAAEQEGDFISNLEEGKNGFSDALAKVTDYLDLELEDGIAKIGEHAEATSDRPDIGGTGGYVLSSVVSALYTFLRHIGTFERPVVAAVNQGGDTDTMGAIVGALSGALHGVHAIPTRLIRGLSNAKHIGDRASLMADESFTGKGIRSLSEFESQLTDSVYNKRKPFFTEEDRRPGRGRGRDDRRRYDRNR